MTTRWVKVDSWHIIREWWDDDLFEPIVKTLCGIKRTWDGISEETFPADEKSCESCLRLEARLREGEA